MLKLILGLKGSGKTKALIEMVNDASHASHGSVVCIEKGQKLIYDVKYKARLVEADAYEIDDAHALFGFIAGIAASDHDLSDVFVDSALKICDNDLVAFDKLLGEVDELCNKYELNCTMTVSLPVEKATDAIKRYL